MRAARALAACVCLMLAACAPTPPMDRATDARASAATAQAADPLTAAASDAVVAPPASAATAPDPVAANPPPREAAAPAPAPASPSLACESDADCAVKDVGSCCGYRPACVNAAAETFPEQVKARCAAEGRMGACGFAPVSGCQCVSGKCAALTEAIGPAPPRPLQ
jgi:hypothetical protein